MTHEPLQSPDPGEAIASADEDVVGHRLRGQLRRRIGSIDRTDLEPGAADLG